jgi:hypothetical protein
MDQRVRTGERTRKTPVGARASARLMLRYAYAFGQALAWT